MATTVWVDDSDKSIVYTGTWKLEGGSSAYLQYVRSED